MIVKTILATSTYRQLLLIETLFEKDEWVTLKPLAKEIGCSTRSLNNDILEINKHFPPFFIETSPKSGIRLIYPDTVSIDFIYRKILTMSTEITFLELLLFEDTLTTEKICTTLFISPSTFSRIVAKFKTHLEAKEIQFNHSPYVLSGNEGNIRNLFIHLILEKYTDTDLPFLAEQVAFVDSLIKTFSQAFDFSLNFPDMKLLRVIGLVNLTRISHQHVLSIEHLTTQYDHLISMLVEAPDFQQRFSLLFGFEGTVSVIKDVFSVFLAPSFVLDSYQQTLNATQHSLSENEFIANFTLFLDTLHQRIPIVMSNKTQVIQEVFNLQHLFFGNNYILFDKHSQFIKSIEKDFPNFMTILKQELRNLKFYPSFEWTDVSFNAVLYTMIIHWKNLLQELDRQIQPISIGIFCDYDIEHSLFLKDLIDYHFGNHVQISLFEALNEQEAYEESAKFAIVLTNISHLNVQSNTLICINSVPTTHDWESMRSVIATLTKDQNLMMPKIQSPST